jgi:hypothetical protein
MAIRIFKISLPACLGWLADVYSGRPFARNFRTDDSILPIHQHRKAPLASLFARKLSDKGGRPKFGFACKSPADQFAVTGRQENPGQSGRIVGKQI